MKTFLSALLLLIHALTITSQAQQQGVDALRKKFDSYHAQTLQEKIYLSTDRPAYLTGETIRFKVYLTDASFHKPLDVSKVAYVEILDKNNLSVLQTKIAIKEGIGQGALFVPASLASGQYVLRGYTNWMKNFAPDFYFSKTIRILNPFIQLEQYNTSAQQPALDVQFFPEGGNLVAGFTCKVGFRVADISGKGMDFYGVLLNQQNDTIARFKPSQFGIGSFTFTPMPDQTYHTLIRDGYGKTHSHNFPSVYSMGYTVSVNDSSQDKLKIKVQARPEDSELSNAVYLFVHSRNRISNSEVHFLQKNQTIFLIDRNSLPDGISHLTIFNSKLEPVCERLYFKHPQRQLSISVATDQKDYVTRRRVRLDIQTDRPNSNLNLSVFKTDSLFTSTGNITSYFWLTSDLKGNIESPEYYFNPTTEPSAIDNLMLTHGWRRFNWQNILQEKLPTLDFIPEYRGHIVRGIVKKDNQPASMIMTYLTAPGKAIQLYASRSNGSGEIKFEMQNFTGSSRLIVQTNFAKDSLYKIEILSPFSNQYSALALPPLQLSKTIQDQLLQRSVAMQVQDAFYRDIERISASPDSTTFYGRGDEMYYLDAYTRFPVMEEVLREYIPGVYVRKRKDGFHFMVRDDVNRGVFSDTPLVLLDGVPIFDEDEIMNFSPLKVKRLDIVTKRYYLGPLNLPGIVSFVTYDGDLGGFTLNPKSISLNYEGLQAQQEFYSPLYENSKQRQSRLPDQRYLLYWNPTVTTLYDGKAQVEFYTSDIPGEYKIMVEGMTNSGEVGSTFETFVVKPLIN